MTGLDWHMFLIGMAAGCLLLACVALFSWRPEKIPETRPEKAEILPPSPDDLAMTFAAALLASGKYAADGSGSAIVQAWWLVPEFYRGRIEYVTTIAPTFFETSVPPLQ